MKLYFWSTSLYVVFLNVSFGIPVCRSSLGWELNLQVRALHPQSSVCMPMAPWGFSLFSAFLASALLILIFSVKPRDTRSQQLELPRLLSAQGAITWQLSHCEGVVSPKELISCRERLIKAGPLGKDTERRGLQLIGDLICEDLI